MKFIFLHIIFLIHPFLFYGQSTDALDKKLGFQDIKLYINVSNYPKFTYCEECQSQVMSTENMYVKWGGTGPDYKIGNDFVNVRLVVDKKSKIILEIRIYEIPNSPTIFKSLEQLYGKGKLIQMPKQFTKGKKVEWYSWEGKKVILTYEECPASNTKASEINLKYMIPGDIREKILKPTQNINKVKGDL